MLQWPSTVSLWTDLLGSQIRYVGSKYRTRAIECGDGPTLVMLHGGGGHAEAFAKNVVRLGQRFHVLAIDMLWHGLSSKPPFPGKALPAYGAQVLDVLDSLGVDKAFVEGEAIGGRAALWLGIHEPWRVAKLVLNNTGGVRFTSQLEDRDATRAQYQQSASAAIETTTRETVRQRMLRLFVDPNQLTDELVEVRYRYYSDPETNRAQAAIHMESDFEEDEVRRISAPALVLSSDSNPLRGPDAGKRLANLLPNGRFELVTGSTIWLQWEQAEVHDRLVTQFLLE
jgi:pimeloyl-ACP methyl ester carboxylesterase